MKKLLILTTLVFFTTFVSAQQFDLKLLINLTTITLNESDSYMTNYYGFEKVENMSNDVKKTYARYYNNDIENTIIITIVFSENKANELEVSLAKNFKIEEIKNELIKKGYIKQSVIDFKFDRYNKDGLTLFVSKTPKETGKFNIKITSDS